MGGNYEKDIFRQLQELIIRCDGLANEMKNTKVQCKEEMKGQECRLKTEFAVEKQALNDRICDLEGELETVKVENLLLSIDNDRMKRILNQDSSNSSKPPSTDQKGKKANTYNGREPSGKKRGGQEGHKGGTLTKQDVIEKIANGAFAHKVVNVGEPMGRCVSKYVIDLEIRPVAIEYRFYENAQGMPILPKEYYSDVTYGAGIKSLAVDLYSEGSMAIERVRNFLNGMCAGNVNLSSGGVYGFLKDFAVKSEGSLAQIKQELLNAPVVCTDATVVSLNGKQAYIRNHSTKDAVLYNAMEKKTIEKLEETDILPEYTGILVHDHETALYHFGRGHGECNVHLLRYLKKNCEDSGNLWSEEMGNLLREMNTARKDAMREERVFTQEEIAEYECRYDALIESGKEETKNTKGKYAKKEENALLNRLVKYKSNHLLFLRDFRVAFDDNLSERDLRKCKTKEKVSGGFRKPEGNEMYCAVMSIIETCKRKKMKVFECIENIFKGIPAIF